MRRLAAALTLLLSGIGPGTGLAQQAEPGPRTGGAPEQFLSPVLTIDPDALFRRSAFGQRVQAEIERETAALAAENRRIEADLTAEEQSLTERRPQMAVEAFRREATAFDEKVQGIRAEQDAKERALETLEDQGREQFLTAAQPVLGRLMLERGAVVILDRRSVFLGFGAIDVTDEAVQAIDREIGAGPAAGSGEAAAPAEGGAEAPELIAPGNGAQDGDAAAD